jgi:MFS family permease
VLDEYKGIPSEAKLLVYLSFLPGLAIGFIFTDLNYFLWKVQEIPLVWVGVIIGTMAIALLVTSIPLGIAADRYGRRNMLILGNVAAGLSLVGFALTKSIPLLFVVAVVEGVGEAAFAVSFNALLADRAGDNKRTSAFSLGAFLGWISGAIGAFSIYSVVPIEALGLTNEQAHVILYVVVGALGLSVTPLVLKVHESKRAGDPGKKPILPRKSKGVLLRYTVYSVGIAFGAGLFVPIIASWFYAAYGVPDAVTGPVLGVSSILTAVAALLAPRLAKRLGLVKAMVISQASSIAFMVTIPLSPTFALAGSLYTVRVFLMNLSNPLGQSLLMGLVSPDERGAASGITASLWKIPNSFSVVVGGFLIAGGFLALPFYVATVLYVFAITAFWFMFKDARLPEEAAEAPQVLSQSSKLESPEEPF